MTEFTITIWNNKKKEGKKMDDEVEYGSFFSLLFTILCFLVKIFLNTRNRSFSSCLVKIYNILFLMIHNLL